MEQFNILVCDDDKSIVDAIEIYLKQEGYHVIKAYNGLEALQALEENEVHLILLDIMMPQMDGLQATVKIRENLNIPIIILSAKSEDTDKILGLNFGADDYITKPFNPLELMARVKSHMRRYTALGSIAEKSNIIRIGGIELDKDAKQVRVEGEPIKMTATEYGILQLLMENAGKVFSIDEIYEKV
ncbi:MAG: response regulator transcription factor, partial [Anaerotignum sp.]|nr:response regulator transcription factor [Anaerotignum sp.]